MTDIICAETYPDRKKKWYCFSGEGSCSEGMEPMHHLNYIKNIQSFHWNGYRRSGSGRCLFIRMSQTTLVAMPSISLALAWK